MDPFRNYDAWLEAPYQAMYAQAERDEAVIDQAIMDMEMSEEEAEAYDWDTYLAEHYQAEDEAMYEDYLEMSNDIAEAYLPDSLDA